MALDYNFNHTGPAHHNFDGSFITHFIFAAFLLLFTIPICVQVVNIYDRLHFHRRICALFKNFHRIFQTVLGLYQLAQECRNLQKPALRTNQDFVQSSLPLDKLLFVLTTRSVLVCQPEESPSTTLPNPQKTLVPQQDRASTESDCQQKNCEILASQEITFLQLLEIFPLTQEHQEEPVPSESITEHHPVNETPVHPVEPVLSTTPLENHWLQNRNQPQDITHILGMTAYEGYVQTLIQTLDSLYVNQPKHFLPLAEEAKRLAEELCKEKQAEQWAGILHEKLLNQSFLDQLNSLQILEQLAPLHLARKHLPSDIIDILERLRKVDNIPFNHLYYIVENCTDRYYSKVIKTFVFVIKRQFVDRQTSLVNTTCSLKFLKEYTDRQAQVWKVLQKYHNLPDKVDDLHSHFESFKSAIETDFKHLKEAISQNVQNIQTSLNIQQTYSSTLCTHINNIYNRLSELQKQIQHHCMYPHQTDTVQINTPEYDLDIDGDNQPNTHNSRVTVSVQGTLNTHQESSILQDDNSTAPDDINTTQNQQEIDWPEAPTIQIPGISSTTSDQPPEVTYNRCQVQPSSTDLKIPELEEDSDQDQFADP